MKYTYVLYLGMVDSSRNIIEATLPKIVTSEGDELVIPPVIFSGDVKRFKQELTNIVDKMCESINQSNEMAIQSAEKEQLKLFE